MADIYDFTPKCIHVCDSSCGKKFKFSKGLNGMMVGKIVKNKEYKNGKCNHHGKFETYIVNVANFNAGDEKIIGKNEIVIRDDWYQITFDYPLNNPLTKRFESKNGFTLVDVINNIIDTYKQIYFEEEQTTKISEVKQKFCLNRGTTNGKYGIRGHDITDLVIERLGYEPIIHQLHMFIGS